MLLLVVLILSYTVLTVYNVSVIKKYNDLILPNTFIDNIDFSNYSFEESKKIISFHEDSVLQKKVTLLHHFKNYLEGENSSNDNQTPSNANNNEGENKEEKDEDKDKDKEKDKKPFTYVKKWMRTRHAIMFRLSNKIVQVCFQDKTEIILSSESRVVTYANKRGERTTYPLSTALEMSNYEMTKRLKYTKDILTHMLNMNQQRNAQKNQSSSTQDKSSKNNDNGKDKEQS